MRDQFEASGSSEVVAALLQSGRLLVLMPGYAAPDNREPFTDGSMVENALVRWLAAVRGSATRQHVRSYRDFYANPRSADYMAERLRELLGKAEGSATVLVVGPAVDIDVAAAPWAGAFQRVDSALRRLSADLPVRVRDYGSVLLVHADALGLGLGALERELGAAFPGKVFVLNGRRQLYRLDDSMRRRLRRRRVLAETRIVEAMLARLVPVAAWALAAFDRLSSRKAA